MIVDDDPSIRYLLSRILIDEGYEVVSAASGSEALAIAGGKEITLVLLDLNMPGMSGQEVLKALAREYPGLPVVIITARARDQLPERLDGVAAYLQKPLDFPSMLKTIQGLLAHSRC